MGQAVYQWCECIHGGDEVHFASKKWKDNADVQALMKKHKLKNLYEVETYFNRRMAKVIDDEIRIVIDRNYQRAEDILNENMDILHNMAQALMDWETIDKGQIDKLLGGEKIDPPEEEPEESDTDDKVEVETDNDNEDISLDKPASAHGHQEI